MYALNLSKNTMATNLACRTDETLQLVIVATSVELCIDLEQNSCANLFSFVCK